jgi:hypothetical protein
MRFVWLAEHPQDLKLTVPGQGVAAYEEFPVLVEAVVARLPYCGSTRQSLHTAMSLRAMTGLDIPGS